MEGYGQLADRFSLPESSGLQVFPNPNEGLLYVESLDEALPESIRLLDAAGREILSIGNPTRLPLVEIPLHSIARGYYLLHVASARESYMVPLISE